MSLSRSLQRNHLSGGCISVIYMSLFSGTAFSKDTQFCLRKKAYLRTNKYKCIHFYTLREKQNMLSSCFTYINVLYRRLVFIIFFALFSSFIAYKYMFAVHNDCVPCGELGACTPHSLVFFFKFPFPPFSPPFLHLFYLLQVTSEYSLKTTMLFSSIYLMTLLIALISIQCVEPDTTRKEQMVHFECYIDSGIPLEYIQKITSSEPNCTLVA